MENKLIVKIIYSFVLIIALSISVFAQQINTNGGFEATSVGPKVDKDISNWTLIVGSPAAADFFIEDSVVYEGSRALMIKVTQVAVNAWDIQAVNEPFKVKPNTTYTYSVWAKADKAGPIVDFTVGDFAYNEWGRASQVSMTKVWQLISYDFTTPANAPDSGRAPMHFGEPANSSAGTVTYYIDNLRIIPKTTDVKNEQIPYNFYLGQNYPNPFNPETKINYSISKSGYISLTVYNILGQKVATLFEGFQNAGTYKVNFDGAGLSSGIYLYRLKANNFIETKKLILLK